MQRRRVVRGSSCLLACCTLLGTVPKPAAAARAGAPPLPLFSQGIVRRSVLLALGKLDSPGCQALFSDFTDADGRPLAASLERLGDSPGRHLRRLHWVNGVQHPRCKDPNVFLVTRVGSNEVQVCPRQFTAFAEREPMKAAGLILHEQLHALGLHEDPPTSEQISRQVWARCGK